LSDFSWKRVIFVLERYAIKHDFVGRHVEHLLIIARHKRAVQLLRVPFTLDNHICHLGRRQWLYWVDNDCAIHAVADVLQNWRGPAMVNECARHTGDK
jgi:hypothetical protein